MYKSYLTRLYYAIFPKPLELQLVEACEAIKGIRKLGTNEEQGFDYLRIVELSKELREELLPRGIVILANDLECIEGIVETPEGSFHEARVKTEFTITNGRRSVVLHSYGSARDQNGYSVAIAQTMGIKALLKRITLTYGDEDDPELPRWAHRPPETTQQKKRLLEHQERSWADAERNSGKTRAEVEALISKAAHRPVTTEAIIAFKPEEFDVAMKILLECSDTTNLLEMSVAQIEAHKRKAQ